MMDPILYSQFDNFFSVWIFLFFVFYYLNLSYFNPIILLIFALITVVIATVYVYLETRHVYHVIRYFHINFLIKIVPIYLIIHRPIYYHDMIVSSVMFFMYYIYVRYYRNFDMIEFYTEMPTDYLKNITDT